MEQIYNCEETGVCKSLMVRFLSIKMEKKLEEKNYFNTTCVNFIGNHKLYIMMIGKASRPR